MAVDDISFDVEEGQIIGFLGPNGAGKTTTLRILTGFLPGDTGTVRVAGCDVSRDSVRVREAIGYLPEGVPLYPEMRVSEFLRFRARLKGISRRERSREVGAALELTHIDHVRRRIVGTLSKGYRQRVGLADALLGQPSVLILDEPTVGLDPEQVIQFRQLLREVGRERTVILSTHILSEVDHICDGAIIIHGGRIAAQDTAANLRRRVQAFSPILLEVKGSDMLVAADLRGLSGVKVVQELEKSDDGYQRFHVRPHSGRDPRADIYGLVRDRDWTLRELHQIPATLEEAFLEIVGTPDSDSASPGGNGAKKRAGKK